MLNEFANAQDLADEAQLLLQGLKGVYRTLGVIGPIEVPCVEAGEVLDQAEGFVAADCLRSTLAWFSC